ncbi:TPA: hypothetical protein N0F65_008449 [Lagenidium giganteum]|uniref:Protein kinase domain-containing protein n=1 Tax=Lagenidium giganteum TaxID=4803 RepID=A0AAV2YQQ3_9STRA|nr:TPA: hypothetical protein N0F65_008449 [Lagenidium giganteum]
MVIGAGTTSKCYRCRRTTDARLFACKIIDKRRLAIDPVRRAEVTLQLRREVEVLKRLDHPHIAKLEDAFENETHIILVMELLEGGELFDAIIERGHLSEHEAHHVVRSVLSAVQYMHDQGVVHRDIKPENLLLTGARGALEVKIIDFGFSKLLGDGITTSSFLGTSGYLAPEILLHHPYTSAVDMWACGVLLYLLLSGRLPFAPSTQLLPHQKVSSLYNLTFPDKYWRGVSNPAKNLVKKLLVLNPKHRYTAKYLFTKDDAIVAFNLFCSVCGIGTLGMPANFARAGPYFGSFAMIFMGFANVYASVLVSKAMLVAPRSVKTFGDLGEWCMGSFGRYAVVISQMCVCLLVPCAFLVLGGNLLTDVFPTAFETETWIILMALMVLPVCLVPTLKEGATAAFVCCVGTIIADIIGIGMLFHGMKGHPAVPTPNVSLPQVASTFGNLALAYGAAVVIPALQRHHSQPERMPQVVAITMVVITVLFITLAWTGYASVGCQISGNLLFNIMPDPVTKLSSLGMKADFGAAVLAYLAMQLHITIAFAVLLHPAFYIAERMVLGMHKTIADDETLPYVSQDTPIDAAKRSSSVVSITKQEVSGDEQEEEYDELVEYKGTVVKLKYITLRIAIVVVLVVAAVLLKDKFVDFSDFIGAFADTTSCIILPIVFYIKRMGKKMPIAERIVAVIVVLTCTVLGAYVTYKTGKVIFAQGTADPNAPKFPFCKPEHQEKLPRWVMELLEGGELFDAIIERGHLSEHEAHHVVRSVLSAVQYMHDQGVVHRDIKPENLLLTGARGALEVKIIDFGFSKLLGDGITTSSFLGTSGYLAPEILLHHPYTSAVDMWACGVLLYLLLSGRLPFAPSTQLLPHQKVSSLYNLTFPDKYWRGVSNPAKNLVKKLLVLNPKHRYTAKVSKRGARCRWVVCITRSLTSLFMLCVSLLQDALEHVWLR